MRKARTIAWYTLAILLAFILPSFAPPAEIITVKGSDTMVILAQRWAEVYMRTHHDVSIQVTGDGSGTGIFALINGLTDICNSSRKMTKAEIAMLKERYSSLGVEIPCARDGITIYLNLSNPVEELTLKQLSDIFAGRIANWKDVGGNSAPINLYGRETNSGTYYVFKDEVVKTDFSRSCQSLPGTLAIVNAVIRDDNGIGYGGAAFANGVKRCKIKVDDNSPGYIATEETMEQNLYPMARDLYMYTRNRPTGAVKKFIDWVLSPEGQKEVIATVYFPLK